MINKNIEVEIRSFISKKKYEKLLDYFKKHGKNHIGDIQETWYFDTHQDLRIQKNNYHSKIWLKKGNMHDEAREEIELKLNRGDFKEAAKLFSALNCKIKIKWFRERDEFTWDKIKVSLDSTKGYGYIIELEIMTDPKEKESVLKELKNKLKELGIPLTPKSEFEKKFHHYNKNWQKLTK